MPAVLNNAIDWLSRPYGAGAITGKPFGVIGTTPTPYGGKWAHEDAAALGRHRRRGRRRGRRRLAVGLEVDVLDRPRRARPLRTASSARWSTHRARRRLTARRPARRLGSGRGRAARPDRARAGRPGPTPRGLLARARRALPRTRRPTRRRRRVRHAHARAAPATQARGARRPATGRRRPAVRRADRDQGPQPDRGRAAPRSARRSSPTSCRTSRDAVTLALEAAGHGQPRQDQHARVRLALLHRARGPPAGGDAVGPDPDGRRLLRRRGRRGGGRAGAGGPGLGRRRLHPDPGLVLRAGRPQAHPRADQRLPDVRRPGGSGDGRADRPDRARRGGDARRARRSPGRGPVLGATSVRRRSSTACDRDPGRLRIARFIDTGHRRRPPVDAECVAA